MVIEKALISQLSTSVEWQILLANQPKESQQVHQAIEKAVENAIDEFKHRFPDSIIASFILETPSIQQELGKSVAQYLSEPAVIPKSLQAEYLGISPELISNEQFNLAISFLWEAIRREIIQIPQIQVLLLAEQQRMLSLKTVDETVVEETITTSLKFSNTLNVQIELPSLITIDGYFGIASNILWNIEYIYLVFALIASDEFSDRKALDSLLSKLRPSFENGIEKKLSKLDSRRALALSTVTPLRLVSAHYGSPASFDLLGIGKILEILRDTVKDLVWRGKHEKQMAELERQGKEAEIEKIRLESEKVLVDIASQKIELLEKTSKLKLSDNDRKIIIYAIMPQMKEITNPLPRKYLSAKSRSLTTRKAG